MDVDKSGYVNFNEILDILMSDTNDMRLTAIKDVWEGIGGNLSVDEMVGR